MACLYVSEKGNMVTVLADKREQPYGYDGLVPVYLMRVDSRYQRPLKDKMVRSTVANYSPIFFGRPHVNLRDDGNYYIMDGQHRVAAATRLGIEEVPCIVYRGLPYEEEARIFVELNRNRNKNSAFQLHHSALAYDQRAQDIDRIVRSHGFELAEKNAVGPGLIRSVDEIYSIYGGRHARRQGASAEMLDTILRVVKAAFGTDQKAVEMRFLRGLARFLYLAQKDAKFSENRLISVMANATINSIYRSARNFAEMNNDRFPVGVVWALTRIYNNGLKSNRILQGEQAILGKDE